MTPSFHTYYYSRADVLQRNTTYYFANKELIAKKNPDGSKYYYHNDHLGSASVLSSSTGSLVESTTYDPWGNIKTGGTKSKFLYTGQEHDSESKLHYYNARYYDPHIHKFTQPDSLVQDVYDPQLLNRYGYVRNNPMRYTDPSGNFIPALVFAAVRIAAPVFIAQAPRITSFVTSTVTKFFTRPTVIQTTNTVVRASAPVTSVAKSAGSTVTNNTAKSVSSSGGSSVRSGGQIGGANPTNITSTPAENNIVTGTNTVYQAVTETGQRYYGITNDFLRRSYEHKDRFVIQPIKGLENLSRYDARAVEQTLINRAGGVDNLANKINSISEKNPLYKDATHRGDEILDMVGY